MARYQLRQRLLTFTDDFDIEDAGGSRAFKVSGKLLTIRDTFVLEDATGNEAATIREKLLKVRDTMIISRGGATLATVKKALISPFRDKFSIDMETGQSLTATGSILDHEYVIRRGSDEIASISKKWFSIRDSYGVDILDGEDHALILAVAVAIDEMSHDGE